MKSDFCKTSRNHLQEVNGSKHTGGVLTVRKLNLSHGKPNSPLEGAIGGYDVIEQTEAGEHSSRWTEEEPH